MRLKKLTTGQIINLINQYTRKLHEQKHVSLTKNQLTTIIPLESHQAIALQVTKKGDGERSVDYFVLEHVYIDKKLKNTVVDPKSLERLKHDN